ncbi:transcription initiation factor TFIID subunit 9B [Octopus sinensis]|uniref:Transcription initiation factor TFIID subunit 9B n=1 Tax=Octopus sinensis TaxID=2607531 RepID=A0A6P7TE97_9MOLL|nr:transcription initiation factor TFIID subunit 9B [Octopus sinensis]
MAVPKSTPRDAQVMAAILKDMGVQDYEPRCINQMLEFAYRYVTDVLDDSKVYSSHASKKNIDGDDVRLAIQCRMDHTFTTPPPRDLLMEIVRTKNSQPLPLIKPYSGPRLPPDRYCLTAPNYKLKSTKKHKLPMNLPVNQYSTTLPSQRISLTPLQQNISGKLGSSIGLSGSGNPTLTVVTKGVSLPTVTIVSKPVSSSSTTISQKPTIRITTGGPKPATSNSNIQSGTGNQHSQVTMNTTSCHVTGSNAVSNTSIISTGGTSLVTPQTININPQQTSQIGSTIPTAGVSNPLKRKLPDDDYDKV